MKLTRSIFAISGMHCISCEKLLEDEFKNAKGVKSVKVDRKKNTAEIEHDEAFSFSEVKNIAEKFDYQAFEKDPINNNLKKEKKINWREWAWVFGIILVLLLGYRVLLNLGVADLIDQSSANLTFGVAFLVGIAASLSSCLAVVGSVVIAFSEKYKSDGNSFFSGAVKPNLLFHTGRVATFFVLGGALGIIGGEINISLGAVAVYTIIIAIVMLWLGLNILGFVPSISSTGIAFPKRITQHWDKIKNSQHGLAPFVLGGLSFFLPCGFTQSMQIFALTTGSFLTGGLILAFFALGTLPVLLGVGVATSWTKNKKWGVFQKVAGVLVIAFAAYTFSSGLAIRGASGNLFGSQNKQETKKTENNNTAKPASGDVQVVEMAVTSRGFSPNTIKLKKGVPVRWVIDGRGVTGCTNKIIVPSLGIEENLGYGETVIEFTPTKAGTVPFSCWMGMVRGKFIVGE